MTRAPIGTHCRRGYSAPELIETRVTATGAIYSITKRQNGRALCEPQGTSERHWIPVNATGELECEPNFKHVTAQSTAFLRSRLDHMERMERLSQHQKVVLPMSPAAVATIREELQRRSGVAL
jgi:hypothetical protein